MTGLLFGYIGVAIMLTLCCVGSVYGLTIVGNASLGALKKDPRVVGSALVLSALPSTQGLYGFAGYFVVQGLLKADMSPLEGVALFAAGTVLGVVGLLSAVRQGQLAANGITAIGSGHKLLGPTMILVVFPELYAIIGLLVVIMVNSALTA